MNIRNFLFLSLSISVLLLLILTFTASFLVFDSIIENHIEKTSRALAKKTFNDMYQIMKRGWTREEVLEFLKSLSSAYQDTPYEINIYRGDVVKQLFGEVPEPEKSSEVLKTFQTGETLSLRKEDTFIYTYPIIGKQECLKCHVNAKVGDIFCVLEVKHDMSSILKNVRQRLFIFFMFLSPIPFIGAFIIGSMISKRIYFSVNLLKNSIRRVNRFRDLRYIEVKKEKLPFEEIEELFHEINSLVTKLKDIAIDKDILEFEIKLLERFVITSEVIKEWREYVRDLLFKINAIIETNAVFCAFLEDDSINIDIFWKAKPSVRAQYTAENIIKDRLSSLSMFTSSQIETANINHNIGEVQEESVDFAGLQEVEVYSRVTILEKPKVAGLFGIIVKGREEMYKGMKELLINAVLASLINVVGSSKALGKHIEEIEYYATRDPLTGLYNRRLFGEFLEHEIERARRINTNVGLIFIDIDNFKLINDTYGHIYGDMYLKEVAVILKKTIREEDIAARFGGDEFAIILPNSDLDTTFFIARRIKKAIEDTYVVSSKGFYIRSTVSIGIAVFPEHGQNTMELLASADNMLLQAKDQGKNRIYGPMDESIAKAMERFKEVSHLILKASENKELVIPYFQPIMNMKENKIEACEVLMRFGEEHIPASKFIDIAERMGTIYKLDSILYEKTFEKISDIKSKHPDLQYFFLNMSSRALILEDFVIDMEKLATKYDIDPSTIVFEITERQAVKTEDILIKFITRLLNAGFRFAIDDFGSGYSSYYYLRKIPINFLKIEGEFVKGMVRNKMDRAFVHGIVLLAKEAGIKTVAEHVETQQIFEAVRAAGFDYAQGFYIGKPSPYL